MCCSYTSCRKEEEEEEEGRMKEGRKGRRDDCRKMVEEDGRMEG